MVFLRIETHIFEKKVCMNNGLYEGKFRYSWTWMNALPILVAWIFVFLYWSDVPTGHDWVFFQILESADSFTDVINGIWSPQNGHRNLLIQILYLADFYIFGFNVKHFLFLNLIIMMIGWWGSWKLFRGYFHNQLQYYFPVTCLWFSLVQYKDLLTTWHLTTHLGILGGIWAIYYISKHGIKNILLAYLFFLISFLSFGNGFIIAPTGLLILLMQKRKMRDTLLWIILTAVTILVYFLDYNIQSSTIQPSAAMYSLLPSISLILKLMANPWVGLMGYFGTIGNAVMLFIGVVYLYTICRLLQKTKCQWQNYISIYAFTIYTWLVFALVSFGRIQRGSSISTAYFTISIQSAIPLIVLSYNNGNHKRHNTADVGTTRLYKYVSALAIFSSIMGLMYGFYWGPYVKGDRVKKKYEIINYASMGYEVDACSYLEMNKKSVFKRLVRDDIYLHVFELDKFKDTAPAFVYNKESSGIYTMINPVKKIQSIGILAHSFSGDAKDSLIVEINKKGMEQPAIRHALSSKDILTNGRAYFTVNDSEFAFGDTLVINITVKGSSIKLPLYQPYPGSPKYASGQYSGVDDRCISIEFNSPNSLNGYYRQLALRNRLKLLKNKLTSAIA